MALDDSPQHTPHPIAIRDLDIWPKLPGQRLLLLRSARRTDPHLDMRKRLHDHRVLIVSEGFAEVLYARTGCIKPKEIISLPSVVVGREVFYEVGVFAITGGYETHWFSASG